MTGADLNPQQAKALHDEISRMARYIHQLANRMGQLQFSETDKLFQLVQAAERALIMLSRETASLQGRLRLPTSNPPDFNRNR